MANLFQNFVSSLQKKPKTGFGTAVSNAISNISQPKAQSYYNSQNSSALLQNQFTDSKPRIQGNESATSPKVTTQLPKEGKQYIQQLYDSATGARTAYGISQGVPDMLGGKPVAQNQFTDSKPIIQGNESQIQKKPSATDTAFAEYIKFLTPSAKVGEATSAYNTALADREKTVAGFEGQGRGIPLSLVRGTQEKYLRQTQPELQRLQGEIGIAQDEQAGMRDVAKAGLDFAMQREQATAEANKPVEVGGILYQPQADGSYKPLTTKEKEAFELSEGQARYEYDANGVPQLVASRGKTYAPGTGTSEGGITVPSGGTNGSVSSLAQIAKEIAPTNSKFANQQFLSNAQYYIDSGDEKGLANLIRKEAVNQLPSADIKAKYLNNITLIENLNRLEDIMSAIESQGVDTNLFTGTKQAITNKIGALGNPELVNLAQQALNIRDLLARARTGAALTESEERLYKQMVPSIFRTEKLNSQIAKNLRESLQSSIDSATGFSLSQQQQSALSGAMGTENVNDEYNKYLTAIGAK